MAPRASTTPPMAETVSSALMVSRLSVGTTPGMADWPSRPEMKSGKAHTTVPTRRSRATTRAPASDTWRPMTLGAQYTRPPKAAMVDASTT